MRVIRTWRGGEGGSRVRALRPDALHNCGPEDHSVGWLKADCMSCNLHSVRQYITLTVEVVCLHFSYPNQITLPPLSLPMSFTRGSRRSVCPFTAP